MEQFSARDMMPGTFVGALKNVVASSSEDVVFSTIHYESKTCTSNPK